MRLSRQIVAITLVGVAALSGVAALGSPASAAYQCFGRTATIVGTPGDDLLVGREDTADVIVGLGGNDIIFGAEDINAATGPGDRLCGGWGRDYIRGGVGEDRIQGGRSNDNVDGSFGYDVITQGGPGNDRVFDCDSEYTGGVRQIKGGPGDDILCVDIDATRMYGEGGDDVLHDLTCGSDSLLAGGPGADQIESWLDNLQGASCTDVGILDADVVRGGDGTDSAIVSNGDRVRDTESVQTI